MSAPVPARLAGRPTTGGGLVVPYISVDFGDGTFALGETHGKRLKRCILGQLCQIDAEPLEAPFVVLVKESALATRFSSEPALHPECARYSAAACPMVAGRMAQYRAGQSRAERRSDCGEPGCDCGGWVPDAPERRSDLAVEPWFAVWLDAYRVAVGEDGKISGLSWEGIEPRKVRQVGGAT